MSIEKALEDLADAVRENTEVLKSMTAAAKASTAGAGRSSSKDKDKDDGDGDGEKAKPTRSRSSKPKVPTAKELGAKTSAYLEVDDEDEYETRKGIIKKIIGKFDAPKMSEIAEEDRAEAMELLETAISGKDPFKKSRRDDDDMA